MGVAHPRDGSPATAFRMTVFLLAAAFIAGLSALVFLHELAHFAVARLLGYKVPVFAVGFHKLGRWEVRPLFERTVCGTSFRLYPLPLGGFVDIPEIEKRESTAPAAHRIAIVAAGPVMSLLCALPLLAGALYLDPLGLGLDHQPTIAEATAEAVTQTAAVVVETGRQLASPDAAEMGGLVRFVATAVELGSLSWGWLVLLLGVATAALAVVNSLPIPPLDGWHCVRFAVEGTTGRPLSPAAHHLFARIGTVVVLALTLLAVALDIAWLVR